MPDAQNRTHRITEWFGLEGTFKNHPMQSSCHGQGHLSLDQISERPLQPELEHIHNFSGQQSESIWISQIYRTTYSANSTLFYELRGPLVLFSFQGQNTISNWEVQNAPLPSPNQEGCRLKEFKSIKYLLHELCHDNFTRLSRAI